MLDNIKEYSIPLICILIFLNIWTWSELNDVNSDLESNKVALNKALTEQKIKYEVVEVEVNTKCEPYINENIDNICEDYAENNREELCKLDESDKPTKTCDQSGCYYE